MNQPSSFSRSICLVLALTMLVTTLMTAPAQAAMIGTDQATAAIRAETVRERLHQMLLKKELQAALIAQGIDPDEAGARVDTLSDSEAIRLAETLDELPAGGGAFGSLITAGLIVFLVLLFTDIMGFTDVFPFVKKHAR